MTIATGEKMYAEDILNLAFFPRGAILMYDGTSWTDNVTLKGWYQCKGGTVNGLTIPDLRDKFIRGYNSGSRTGGNDSVELSEANLPSHSHSVSGLTVSGLSADYGGAHPHSGSGTTNSGSGGHVHSVSGSTGSNGGHSHGVGSRGSNNIAASGGGIGHELLGNVTYSDFSTNSVLSHSHSISLSTPQNGGTHSHDVNVTIPESGSHSHTISGGTVSCGTIGNTGSGTPFDIKPSYYALIYIIKMTAAGSLA
jgi:microcystin-dependent protein